MFIHLSNSHKGCIFNFVPYHRNHIYISLQRFEVVGSAVTVCEDALNGTVVENPEDAATHVESFSQF